jgi:glucose/arabinose dehydrogenase
MTSRTLRWALLAVLTLACSACGGTVASPTWTASPTSVPSATPTLRSGRAATLTPIPPSPTASATLTPEPTPTLSPTPTLEPTATPTLTPMPTPEPTATATVVMAVPTPAVMETRVIPTEEEIRLPQGFGISVFAANLRDPRMMTLGPDGIVYVAERGAGRIVRLPDEDKDGVSDTIEVVAEGLNAPSSIDFFRDGSLYVGETTRVLRLSKPDRQGRFQDREVIVEGLPQGGHNTRTVLFSPDGSKLFVSVGSSCNVCIESDDRRAAILRYDPDGSGEEIFAHGLRNAVGITFRPGTDELWATNNGRDRMGDDLPPETVYRVQQGTDYGWPRCHAGRIIDPDFGQAGDCEGVEAPEVEMQAHSAPLGLTFYDGEQFPEAYQGDLFVAFHGSWNRSVPTGYKVVRIEMDDGTAGPVTDFAAGWLRQNGSRWGRPVDVLVGADGSLYVSDDERGYIYRVFYAGEG